MIASFLQNIIIYTIKKNVMKLKHAQLLHIYTKKKKITDTLVCRIQNDTSIKILQWITAKLYLVLILM